MRILHFTLFIFLLLLPSKSFSKNGEATVIIDRLIAEAKFDSAKVFIHSQLEQTLSEDQKAGLNYQLMKVLFIQSDYHEALKVGFESIDKIRDEDQKVNFNFLIGCIYSAINDYQQSLKYLDFVALHGKDRSLSVQANLLLSELHLELRDSTKALQSLTEAFEITNESNMDPKIINHVAMQYNFYSKNYEACKQLNLNVIKDSTSFINTKSFAYSMIGECLMQQDSLHKARHYFDEFLNLTLQINDPEQIKIAAKKLIEVYEKLGNQEKANTYHKIYNESVNDSMSFSIDKYRDLYLIEKEREVAMLKNNAKRNYIILAFCLLGLLTFSLFYFKKNKNKLEKFRSLQKEKAPAKKITISETEIQKIKSAIENLIRQQRYLSPGITRNSFCLEHKIKSERYLSQYINEEHKVSFTTFLNDLRVGHAFQRIQEDPVFRNYKIEEIAKASGFGSKKSFERAFLAKYKKTPYKLILSITDSGR